MEQTAVMVNEEVRDQVKENLGKYWADFDIDEIISRVCERETDLSLVPEWKFQDISQGCPLRQSESDTEKFDYRKALRQEIRECVLFYNAHRDGVMDKFETRQEAFEYLYNETLQEERVMSGVFAAYPQIEKNLNGNYDLLSDALERVPNLGGVNPLKQGAEYCDRLIRFYLLSECVSAVLDEIKTAKWS